MVDSGLGHVPVFLRRARTGPDAPYDFLVHNDRRNQGDTILISACAPFFVPASAVAGYDPMPLQSFQQNRHFPFHGKMFLPAIAPLSDVIG